MARMRQAMIARKNDVTKAGGMKGVMGGVSSSTSSNGKSLI